MKAIFKKFLCLSVAVVMLLPALFACGAKDADKFRIGGIGPLTGGAAVYGTAVKNGAQLAIDEINAAGGINGVQLVLYFEDDEHKPEKAVNAYNSLKDQNIHLLVGTVTSKPCVAVVALTKADNMFQITPSGSAVESISGDNAFRICFSDPNQGIGAADYIADHALASKVAVIYDSSDVYSSGIYETFKTEAAVKNLSIVTAQAFTGDAKTDFSVQLQKVKESGADLVFLPIYYEEAALILQQAQKAGLNVKYFGCDGLDGVIDQLKDDIDLAEGVMLLTPFAADAKDERTQKFVAAYKAKYDGETPNQFAADAYDAVYTVKAAMEKAGVTDPSISASDLCEKLKAAMLQISVAGVTGDMTWDVNGEPTKTPQAMKIVISTDENGNKVGSYSAMD